MITFHLTLEGNDNDLTGPSYHPVKITIEGGSLVWGAAEIKEFKECLALYFDVYPKNIRTDEEEKRNAEDLEKYIKDNLQ